MKSLHTRLDEGMQNRANEKRLPITIDVEQQLPCFRELATEPETGKVKGTDGVQRGITRGYPLNSENTLLPIPFGYSVSKMQQPIEDDTLLVIIPSRIDGRIVTTSKRCAVTPFGSRKRTSN